jgi:glycine/D-amino acid oxidase-like deaminating enzyme
MVLNLKGSDGDPALARRLYDLTLANIHTLKGMSAATGIDCELEQNGALTVLRTEAEARDAKASTADSGNLPIVFWDRERTASALGTRVYTGALFDPGAGQVHLGKLVRMWKSAAEAGGVNIFEQTPVVRISEGPVHVLSARDGHSVCAPMLILATNAYTSKLGYLRNAVAPIHNYVGITPPLAPNLLASIGWNVRIPFNDSLREVYYSGQTQDGRIHFGGGPVDYGFNNEVGAPPNAPRRFEGLHREFSRVFPSLANIPFEIQWSGLVDVSLNQQPAVGQIGRHKNILYAIGYSGEGVNLTSVFGRILADLAAGRRNEWEWCPFSIAFPRTYPTNRSAGSAYRLTWLIRAWLGYEYPLQAVRSRADGELSPETVHNPVHNSRFEKRINDFGI